MNQEFKTMELDQLNEHIINTHHVYVRKAMPEISALSEKVAKVHGSEHTETIEIAKVFAELAPALEEHMAGEEKYLFPYIDKLLNAKRNGEKLPKPGFGSIDKPLQHHYEDHNNAWNSMMKINELSKGYQLPEDACGTYTALYQHLQEFENDLKQHIHVENEILFGRAIELEKEVVE